MSVRQPAYGRALKDKRRAGLAPANGRVWVFDHWPSEELPAELGWFAVVPPDSAVELDYSFAAGLDCIAVALSRFDAIHLGHCLLPFKPKRLTLLCPDGHVDLWP